MFFRTSSRSPHWHVLGFALLAMSQGLLLFAQPGFSIPAATAQVTAELLDRQDWYGELEAGGRQFRFVVTTWLDETGKREGKLISKDEGDQEFTLDNVVVGETELRFEIPSTKAGFAGTSEAGQAIFKGTWSQRGAKLGLEFRAVDAVPVDQPDEVWVGDMQAGLQQLKMQFRVYHKDDGTTKAYFDSLSQKAGGFIADWKGDDLEIAVSVPAVMGKFSGKLADDRATIEGEWTQGTAFPLTLKKAAQPAPYKVLRRPQHPVGDPDYRVEEVAFENPKAGIRLAGTLTCPGDPAGDDSPQKKYPAAILISGSGPQDRDETLLGHKPFWVLADHLTRNGIAVLRFDERGVGKSTGEFQGSTSEDFAEDVRCAVSFLKGHPAIDGKAIGLVGHSEGGLVAPMVAAEDPDVAWIVLLAGPGVNGEQIIYSQGKLIIESAGGSPDDAAKVRILQEACLNAIRDLPADKKVDDLVQSVTDEVARKTNSDGLDEPGARTAMEATVAASLKQLHDPWFRFFARHEPGPVLQKVRCPVLALNGERDVQVDPDLNLPRIEEALLAGGNKRFKILELPELNHLFQTSKTGSTVEYESIEETFAPAALKVLADWIAEQSAAAR